MNGQGIGAFFRHPVVSALIVASIVGGISYAGTQGALEGAFQERLKTVERDAQRNTQQILDLVTAINENTRETSVLSERMRGIIQRMDERRRAREETR